MAWPSREVRAASRRQNAQGRAQGALRHRGSRTCAIKFGETLPQLLLGRVAMLAREASRIPRRVSESGSGGVALPAHRIPPESPAPGAAPRSAAPRPGGGPANVYRIFVELGPPPPNRAWRRRCQILLLVIPFASIPPLMTEPSTLIN